MLHEQDFDWSLLEDLEKDEEPQPTIAEDDTDFFAVAEQAIDISQEVFDRADGDDSGALDALELSDVVIDALRALGANVPHDIEQALTGEGREAYIQKTMARFDKDNSGVLEFPEFLQMLCCAPFRALLPKGGIREKMPELVIKGAGLPPKVKTKKPTVSPEQRVLAMAQEIFEAADVNQSGLIDQDEVSELIQAFFRKVRKKIPRDMLEDIDSIALTTMERFDKDGTGTLDFNEFVGMLCMRPWKGLLPRELRDTLGGVVFKEKPPPEAPKKPKKKAPGAEDAMVFAQQLFDETDQDGSGFVDQVEFKLLGSLFMKKMGKTLPPGGDFSVIPASADEDNDGTLNFDEFLALICQPPWSDLLPATVVDELRQRLKAKVKYNPAPARASPAEKAFLLAKEMFEQGDVDQSGALDHQELSDVIVNLFARFDKKLPYDFRSNLATSVKKSMARFDLDNNGTLEFMEFCQMLCCNPFRGLLPPKIRKEMPGLVLRDGAPKMPRLAKPEKEELNKMREMPLEDLLKALNMQAHTNRFTEEGFTTVGDMLDVAFKLVPQDFDELGVTNQHERKRLLQVVRSGNPIQFVEEQQAREQAASAYDSGAKFESLEMPATTSSFSVSKPLPRRKAYPHLKLPGKPSSTPKRSPCSPVRAPSRAGAPRRRPQQDAKVEWNLGMAPNRPENSSWYDRTPNLRVKSKMCALDRPTFPKDVVNQQDSDIWKFYIQQETRAMQRAPPSSDSYSYYFTPSRTQGRP